MHRRARSDTFGFQGGSWANANDLGLGMSSPSGQPSTEDTTSASQDMETDTANDIAKQQLRPGDRKRPGGSGAGRGAVPANGWGDAARAPGTAAAAGSQLPPRTLTTMQPPKPEAAADGAAVPAGSWGPSSLTGGQFAQRAMANMPPTGMQPPGAGLGSEPLGPGPRSLRAVSQPLMAARPSSGVQQHLGLPPLDEAAGGRAGPGHARSRSHTFGTAALPLQGLELGPGASDFPIEEEGHDQEQPEPSGRSGSRSTGPRGGRAARSGSGNDSGGGGKDKDKSRGANNGRSNRELLLLDPKRVKRIIANRLSAAKSKERKQQYMEQLEQMLDDSSNERDALCARMERLNRDTERLDAYTVEAQRDAQALAVHLAAVRHQGEALLRQLYAAQAAAGRPQRNPAADGGAAHSAASAKPLPDLASLVCEPLGEEDAALLKQAGPGPKAAKPLAVLPPVPAAVAVAANVGGGASAEPRLAGPLAVGATRAHHRPTQSADAAMAMQLAAQVGLQPPSLDGGMARGGSTAGGLRPGTLGMGQGAAGSPRTDSMGLTGPMAVAGARGPAEGQGGSGVGGGMVVDGAAAAVWPEGGLGLASAVEALEADGSFAAGAGVSMAGSQGQGGTVVTRQVTTALGQPGSDLWRV